MSPMSNNVTKIYLRSCDCTMTFWLTFRNKSWTYTGSKQIYTQYILVLVLVFAVVVVQWLKLWTAECKIQGLNPRWTSSRVKYEKWFANSYWKSHTLIWKYGQSFWLWFWYLKNYILSQIVWDTIAVNIWNTF